MSKLSQQELIHCLYAAQSAAMQAGHHIMDYFGGELDIQDKGYGYEKSDLVTLADQNAQKMIEKILHNYHPNIGFLAEENGHDSNESRFTKDYFWCVDPLDGTKAFVSGNSGFAVSIGLVQQSGQSVLGVCFFPHSGNLYSGINGQLAEKNGHQMPQSSLNGQVKILLSEAESLPKLKNEFYHSLSDQLKSELEINKIKAETLIAPVEKGIKVIDSDSPVIYYGLPRPQLGVSVWDFAAIDAIIHGQGAFISDIFGNPLELNRKESTFMHHKGFLVCSHKQLADTVISTYEHFQSRYEEEYF